MKGAIAVIARGAGAVAGSASLASTDRIGVPLAARIDGAGGLSGSTNAIVMAAAQGGGASAFIGGSSQVQHPQGSTWFVSGETDAAGAVGSPIPDTGAIGALAIGIGGIGVPAIMAPAPAIMANLGSPQNGAFGPKTPWHYSPNANWPSNFDPNLLALGFNLADVASAGLLPFLPAGVKALVYVGNPNGVDTTFTTLMTACAPYLNSIFAFYLADTADPDPAGTWGTFYDPANLKAQADYIHTNFPGAKTFIWLANLGSSYSPNYLSYNGFAGYTPATTDIDYYGIEGYAVRDDLNNGFDPTIIGLNYNAAVAAGIPGNIIVPTYQTFGLGNWGAPYEVPTAAQLQTMIVTWASYTPTPVFDYFYSWGPQNNDVSLNSLPSLQAVAQQHNLPPGGLGAQAGISGRIVLHEWGLARVSGAGGISAATQ